MGAIPGEGVPSAVLETVERLVDVPIDDHGVNWKPARWNRDDLKPLRDPIEKVVRATEETDDGWRMIRRRDVLSLAPPQGELWSFFVAAMVWGYGDRPYGPYRTARVIDATGPEQVHKNLSALIDASRLGAEEAWQALRVDHRTKWLGPAFATKVAYFAAFSAEDPPDLRALIADANTSAALWQLSGISRSASQRGPYLEYVQLAHRWAAEYGWRPDEVERALFEIGKSRRQDG